MSDILAVAEERAVRWVKRHKFLAGAAVVVAADVLWIERDLIREMLQWISDNAAVSMFGGVVAVWWQLRSQQKTLALQYQWKVYDSGLTTLSIFVNRPELRPYFYGNKDDSGAAASLPVPQDPTLLHQVMAAAEILCDHWEATVLSETSLTRAQIVNTMWARYMQDVYHRSPSLQYFLREEIEGFRYSDEFKSLVARKPVRVAKA